MSAAKRPRATGETDKENPLPVQLLARSRYPFSTTCPGSNSWTSQQPAPSWEIMFYALCLWAGPVRSALGIRQRELELAEGKRHREGAVVDLYEKSVRSAVFPEAVSAHQCALSGCA